MSTESSLAVQHRGLCTSQQGMSAHADFTAATAKLLPGPALAHLQSAIIDDWQ